MAIEFIHGSHDAVLEFLFGCDADVAQHRAGDRRAQLGQGPFDATLDSLMVHPDSLRHRKK
jgi:hypothetical protein